MILRPVVKEKYRRILFRVDTWAAFPSIMKARIGCSSLRGGGGELGNLKPRPMAPTKLHNIKLKHAIYMCHYGSSNVKPLSQKSLVTYSLFYQDTTV